MESHKINIIAKSSRARPIIVILSTLFFPIIFSILLIRAKYNILDYFTLIQNGELSFSTQFLMWTGFIILIIKYLRPALIALRTNNYIFSDDEFLNVPEGRSIKIDEIKELKIRKGFWHKILEITTSETRINAVVTFAKGGVRGIVDGIEKDQRLRRIALISPGPR